MKGKKFWLFLISCALLLLLPSNPLLADLPQFKVLADDPIDDTFKNVYHGIEEILPADSRLILLAEFYGSSQKEYILKVQIYNAANERIYYEEKKVRKYLSRAKPYFLHSIPLSDELRSRLSPGLVNIKLEISGIVYAIQQLTYRNNTNVQKKSKKIIILPFYDRKHQYFDYRARFTILKTFSDALKCELQRYFSDVSPAETTAKKITDLDIESCFGDEECLYNLKVAFGEGLFLIGNASLPPASNSWQSPDKECFLEIFLFDSNRDEIKKYKSSILIRTGDDPIKTMKVLLDDILANQGMLLFLRSL